MSTAPVLLTVVPELSLKFGTYKDVKVWTGTYINGNGLALMLGEPDEPITTASVNIDGQEPAEGCVWIKNWSENEGVLEALTEAGVIQPTGRTVPTGFVVAHEAKVLTDFRDVLLSKATPTVCADCGEEGELTGHMGCQFPQDRG